MTNRPHFDDLTRRYREKDEVSEFQRLWAIFNHWLLQHTGRTNDRDCIEQIKQCPELTEWIKKVVSSSELQRPQRVLDGYAGAHPRFTSNNCISEMFREVYSSSTVETRINLPWRPGTEQRVHITNAIVLTDDEFEKAYRIHAMVLDEGIANFDLTLLQTLPALGIYATGCCFYRGDVDLSLPTNTDHWAQKMADLFSQEPLLQNLTSLIQSSQTTPLSSDVIETLYNVRNTAMHGSLDFLNKNDNAAARASYDVLDSLIQDIRDSW